MAIKKSELYSSLWKSCDELRGGMDSSQYKDYVLVLLFIKYVSDKYAGKARSLIEIPEGGSFQDMVALKGQKDIGEKMNLIIAKLAEANDLRGVIDVADFNDEDKLGRGKDMVDRLSNLIGIFQNPALDFSKNRAEGDDLMGDAYEYLMRFFATESGKSKGQFLTPSEVSRILAKLVGISSAESADKTLYDPTCGSGSLLLKAADEAPNGISIYGQEMDNATAALAKMNMILHDNATAEIWQDNTLVRPHFKQKDGSLKTFDFIVANPPFSSKNWSNGFSPAQDEYGRFEDGVPPPKNGDFAFLQHIIRSLKSTGRAAVILPHGVLFRGNAEAVIRKNLIRKGYIKGIIGLPANLFYGTGIPACIVVVDKNNAVSRSGIFMMDASKGFRKDGNKNRLRAQDIHKIVDSFNRQFELPKYSRLVPMAEIEANDFNLNIPRYIDSSDAEDLQDIEAHLLGGIPNRDIDALERYWQVLPEVRNALFKPSVRASYSDLQVEADKVKSTIFEHSEFKTFVAEVNKQFVAWKTESLPKMKCISAETHPKQLIGDLSESLLSAFEKAPLLDPYDVYQRLMDYWDEAMQDDAYMLVSDGWVSMVDERPNVDLIPSELIVNRFFKTEQAALEKLETERDAIASDVETFVEENSGDGSLLDEARTDAGKLTAKSVKARIKDIKQSVDDREELELLEKLLVLMDKESAADKKLKDAKKALDKKVADKYPHLSEDDVKTLVVEDKWLARLDGDVHAELEKVSMALTSRVQELAERYAHTAPALTSDVSDLESKVAAHLKKMGFAWN
ncbi:type I restriction-modification system subunit M [Herbaspirillum sp.]|uniref:type I restriction-modification system subunit M n=1 Tax=Herbaspirillum sp. TaxID=1890675 RepID=UPI000C0B8A7E|nr:type I restriction-modification system subunit M [Herbaspirillum sp.]MAF01923.1 type I restriction-modification system subunit M [Herbaspirillum sp.]MBO17979.1 type I restriction-modification system subunit M [Herbaspirillum sp.]|tara:strand:+ start:25578 stop:27956 length:2379 start_codon:yes stop_codon:yes gene_type:complete